MVPETLEKVLLALVPRAVIAVMHTTMIRASMTAYSTAVGPSSRLRKFTTRSANLRMVLVLSATWQSAWPVSTFCPGSGRTHGFASPPHDGFTFFVCPSPEGLHQNHSSRFHVCRQVG